MRVIPLGSPTYQAQLSAGEQWRELFPSLPEHTRARKVCRAYAGCSEAQLELS
jgi:hypothetical protein